MKHNQKNPYAVAIHVGELKTSGRRAEIARRLIAGESQAEIIQFLTETFNMDYKQAKSEYRQGYVYIYQQCELSKDEIRKLNMARLEQLWEQAETDAELEAKEYYKIQMKNVDLTNKTAGIYDADVEKQNTGQEFTVTFGPKNN